MNEIISSNTGEYLSMSFTGQNGKWDLISSECSNNVDFPKKYSSWLDGGIGKTIDTFINRKSGRYLSLSRSKIYLFAEEGKINAA